MLINYQNVEICQQEHAVLSEVNFQVNESEFIYLIGKVGSGKTSLLKTFTENYVLNQEIPQRCSDTICRR